MHADVAWLNRAAGTSYARLTSAPVADRMDVSLLGPIEARVAGRPCSLGTTKQRALLAMLALHVNTTVSSDCLVDALWGERHPPSAHKMVQHYVSQLRKALAAAAGGAEIVTRGRAYELRLEADAVDVGRFERLIADGAPREALALWRGPPLADVADAPFAAAEIRRLDELRLTAVELAIERDLAAGRHREVVGQLESLVAEEPLRERLHAQRMLALYRCGRQAEALEAYRDAHRVTVDQIGVEPGPELTRLHQAMLAHDPALEPPPVEPAPGDLPSGIVTFVLTDVEGSTRLWDAEPAAMAVAMQRHDELVAATIEASGGRVLKAKGEGDATLSVFMRASDAVAAAAALQAAFQAASWPGGLELRVRVAVHTGEAFERDDDYFGPALNRASRLRSLARGGATVISRTTAEIVHDRLAPELQLIDLGQHELRGLSRPERVFELRAGPITPAPKPGPVRLAVPQPLRPRGRSAFVGRKTELARLHELWKQSPGESRAAFIAGEPGIGKTRLAFELARALHADGALVLYGRCDDGLTVPYQPFVEALRPSAAAIGVDRIRAELGRLSPHLALLLPELDALGEPRRADPETERLRLFEAVAAFVNMATSEQPALLVLDDLQWAAAPTLLLMRHLIRAERTSRLLILGTYRETELDRGHQLAQVLADLQRDASTEAVTLGGLDESGISELLEAAAGHPLDARASTLVAALHASTGGNPFFIGEVLAHLVESGAVYREGERWTGPRELDVPARLRQVIDQRVGRLSAPATRALAVAAVAGSPCTLDVLERVLDQEPELLDGLEEAVAAGLLTEAGPAGYAFAHALVRQTIYQGLGSARRMRLHRRIGEALEALGGADANPEALAHHFAHAAADGQSAKAADYALAAGRSATARVGYEEAAAHYERGLEALALAHPPAHERRCELLLELAEVRWAVGDRDRAREACLRAAELAQRLDDAQRLARAALIFSGPPRLHLTGPVTESVLDLLERALTALGRDETPLRARVMSRLAVALAYLPAHRERSRMLAGQALAVARRIGEPAALAEVLASSHWATWGPDNVDERLTMNEELARRAAELDDGMLAAYAHGRGVSELLEVADVDASQRRFVQLERLADGLQQRYPRWLVTTIRAARAFLDGRLEDCEAHARDGLAVGQGFNEDTARGAFGMQMLFVRWEQGRFDDALGLAEGFADHYAQLPGVRVLLARAYAELGRDDDARAELELLARGDFADVPRDAVWLPMMYGLSLVASQLEDTRRAERLYELLLPYADRCVVGFSVLCWGSSAWPLGLLATALGRLDAAADHFEQALVINARIESPLYVAHTQHDYARMLLLRGRAGDRERGDELLEAALATAEEHRLCGLADRARALAGRPAGGAARRPRQAPS